MRVITALSSQLARKSLCWRTLGDSTKLCCAEECMAWRWATVLAAHVDQGYCGLVPQPTRDFEQERAERGELHRLQQAAMRGLTVAGNSQ